MSRFSFPSSLPTLIGTVTTPRGLKMLARTHLAADAVEVRVDALLARKVDLSLIWTALSERKIPVLLTLRLPAEGGQYAWRQAERRNLFLKLLPQVEAIDVELASLKVMQPVIQEARRQKKTLVLSAHALKKPATVSQYTQWLKNFRPFGPSGKSILKIASQIETRRDLQQLAGLILQHPHLSIAAMGLGPKAGISRHVLAALGSRLVYGYLDEAAAPGQPSIAELKKLRT